MTPVVLIGGGGHAKVVVDVLRLCARPILGCIVGNRDEAGPGVAVLGDDTALAGLDRDAVDLVIAIGSLAPGSRRVRLFEALSAEGWRFAAAVHPAAIVAADVVVGAGSVVMAGAVIQPGVTLGRNVVVNTGATIDHDCVIADHVHMAPGVTLSGGVSVGADAHLGTACTIIEGRTIGAGAQVAAGAVVVRDVPAGRVALGVPARLRDGG